MRYKKYQPIRKILRLRMVMGWKKYLHFITRIHYGYKQPSIIKPHMKSVPIRYSKIIAKISLQPFYLKLQTISRPCKVISLRKHRYKKLQIEKVNQYIKNNLLNGEAIIVISGPMLRKAITSKLNVLGMNVVQEFKDKGQLKLFNSEFFLANIRIDNDLDPDLFHKNISALIQVLQLKYHKVHAIDETVDILWRQENRSSALKLKDMWSEFNKCENFRYYPLSYFMAVMNFKGAFIAIMPA